MNLVAPRGDATRPTLSRVRESLFMILQPRLEGAVVLDLFAGAGALGLEALSRGASEAHFVETSRPAALALKENIRRLGFADRSRVIQDDALRYLARTAKNPAQRFDLVLLDPPYGKGLAILALEKIAAHAETFLNPDALVVAQVGKRDPLSNDCVPLIRYAERAYGETRIEFFKRQ